MSTELGAGPCQIMKLEMEKKGKFLFIILKNYYGLAQKLHDFAPKNLKINANLFFWNVFDIVQLKCSKYGRSFRAKAFRRCP